METQYAVALPLNELMKQELEQLHATAVTQDSSLAEKAGKLMSEATCHIIDYIFTDMVQQFANVKEMAEEKIASFKESLSHIEEIKAIIRKYFGWAVGWFDANRLKPVIAHYHQLINECSINSAAIPCLIYAIPDVLATKALDALNDLKSLKADNALHAIECLIEIIDVGVSKLLKEPKELLKFNFIANKTLDGVMNMTTALSYKSLRKLGQAMDPALFQTASGHLQQFIIPHPLSWHEAVGIDPALHPSIS
jgi:hypothetical protein